jgi:hypothetical protein
MPIIQFEKFNFNQFYDKTPKPLKYFLVIALILVGSYYLYATKIDKSDERQLAKIEESISTTYTLIGKIDDFRKAQYVFNEQILDYLEDIYTLVEELNENTNQKFDLLLKAGGANTEEIIERLTMLNSSFEKLQKAYTPKDFKEPKVDPAPTNQILEEKPVVDTPVSKRPRSIRASSITATLLDENGKPVLYILDNSDTAKIKNYNGKEKTD